MVDAGRLQSIERLLIGRYSEVLMIFSVMMIIEVGSHKCAVGCAVLF